jgi:hypothetical protein
MPTKQERLISLAVHNKITPKSAFSGNLLSAALSKGVVRSEQESRGK